MLRHFQRLALAVALAWVSPVHGTTLYFTNAVDGEWDTATNWFTDAACTTTNGPLPVTGDALIFVNGSNLSGFAPTVPIQPASVRFEGNAELGDVADLSYMTCAFTFVGTSRNGSDTGLASALFYDSATQNNFGTQAYAEFHDSSVNIAGQITHGKFYDSAINYSPVELPVVLGEFCGSSKNGALGESIGHCTSATFSDTSTNEGTVDLLRIIGRWNGTNWVRSRLASEIGGTVGRSIVDSSLEYAVPQAQASDGSARAALLSSALDGVTLPQSMDAASRARTAADFAAQGFTVTAP